MRYSERGGVVLGCRRRGADLLICVYDTGPGITEQQREHIYMEFRRSEHGSPWGEKGLGLGLSICDRFARLLGHELTLTSHPGHGSAFGVRVPRNAQGRRHERSRPAGPALQGAGLEDFRILCVDNDLSILDGMEALLEQWGASVVKARNAAEALRLLATRAIDAALVDYHLGDDLDGMTLIRRITEIRGASCAVAMITADHAPEVSVAARLAGIPLLYKPLRPAALRALLSSFKRQATQRMAV